MGRLMMRFLPSRFLVESPPTEAWLMMWRVFDLKGSTRVFTGEVS
tara:strand:- start:1204 stop:1338 length:135 start_codon:yes stop_codon:yes gene_type:complete